MIKLKILKKTTCREAWKGVGAKRIKRPPRCEAGPKPMSEHMERPATKAGQRR